MQLPLHTDRTNGYQNDSVPALELIGDRLRRVREQINRQLEGCPDVIGISRLLDNFNSTSGKMLRPRLVLLTGAACGKITDTHIRIGAIVEIIHNATLLHDDVIDEGRKRRGLPTINSLWGNESAVLLGDFLLSQVFKMCVDLKPKIAGVIAAAAAQTCEGELRQVTQRQNWQLSEAEYIDIIAEKSASLFSSCCLLGALLAQASRAQVRSLADFGRDIGIAFQITDDLLDIIGDESKTGKTLGSDVDKNKLTLAVIHLLRAVRNRERSAVIKKLNTPGTGKSILAEMLRSYGSLEYARIQAQNFVATAIRQLACLKESASKNALIETARFIAGRAG